MRGVRKILTSVGFLTLALLPLIAAVSPEATSALDTMAALDTMPAGQLPVAIAQPLAVLPGTGFGRMLPESGLLMLVGSALLGLAAVVRRTTN